jgi:Sulfotransferase domain
MTETTTDPVRIAMWSGPRNISTAMMRSFENRPDCAVIDEPFYAAYLAETGLDHPMRDAVLASQPTDWRQVMHTLLGPAANGRHIFYQKHMTHHMLDRIGRSWTAQCRNAFLIRTPESVLISYRSRRDTVTLEDIGYRQQAELFDAECDRLGTAPPVIDAEDLLADPPGRLKALCDALKIPFRAEMLRWPAGPRSTDGVWAPAWYAAVEQSTCFTAPSRPSSAAPLEAPLLRIAELALPFYEHLKRHKLAVSDIAAGTVVP